MKCIVHCALALSLAGLSIGASIQPEKAPPPKKTITYSELQQADVIGRLGVKLGTCVSIRAEVVSGDSLRTKADSGRYLLRVLEVDGRALAKSELFSYSGAPGYSEMPTGPSELSKLVRNKSARELIAAETALIEEGLVGTERRLVVYEVGRFDGMPCNLPASTPEWQSSGFGFGTSLTIVADDTHHQKPK